MFPLLFECDNRKILVVFRRQKEFNEFLFASNPYQYLFYHLGLSLDGCYHRGIDLEEYKQYQHLTKFFI